MGVIILLIRVELDDIFDDDEIRKLKKVIGLNESDDPSETLLNITNAALNEYKQMLLGMGLPSRADEILQYRLYYLIKHYFRDTIPTESQVSSMFQLTPQKSRSLIRNVTTRFKYDLENELDNTLKETISSAEWVNQENEFHIVIKSNNVIEQLNRIIASLAPDLDLIRKVRFQAGIYLVSDDSFMLLCQEFGVDYSSIRPEGQMNE